MVRMARSEDRRPHDPENWVLTGLMGLGSFTACNSSPNHTASPGCSSVVRAPLCIKHWAPSAAWRELGMAA